MLLRDLFPTLYVASVGLYGAEVYYHQLSEKRRAQIERVYNRGLRAITGCIASVRVSDMRAEANLPSFQDMVYKNGARTAEKVGLRPATFPARTRFEHDGRHAAHTKRESQQACFTTLREACPRFEPTLPRVPRLQLLDRPLFRVEHTALASSVTFLLSFDGVPAKAKMSKDRALRFLNFKVIDELQKLHDDSRRNAPDVPAIDVEVIARVPAPR
jgi:hypothetical protein